MERFFLYYDAPITSASNSLLVNPLLHEFLFSFVFEILPKIGCYRLPTLRRSAHMKLFWQSLLILRSKFWPNVVPRPRYATKC